MRFFLVIIMKNAVLSCVIFLLSFVLIIDVSVLIHVFTTIWYNLTSWQFTASGN